MKPIEIHRRMSIQYGDRCMSRTQVYEWTDRFKNGVTSVEDSRLGPAFTAVSILKLLCFAGECRLTFGILYLASSLC